MNQQYSPLSISISLSLGKFDTEQLQILELCHNICFSGAKN